MLVTYRTVQIYFRRWLTLIFNANMDGGRDERSTGISFNACLVVGRRRNFFNERQQLKSSLDTLDGDDDASIKFCILPTSRNFQGKDIKSEFL